MIQVIDDNYKIPDDYFDVIRETKPKKEYIVKVEIVLPGNRGKQHLMSRVFHTKIRAKRYFNEVKRMPLIGDVYIELYETIETEKEYKGAGIMTTYSSDLIKTSHIPYRKCHILS